SLEAYYSVTVHAGANRYATGFCGSLHFFQQRLKPRLDANLLAGFVSPRRANTQRCTEFITCTLGDMLPNHLENNLSSRTLIRIMGPVFLIIRCPSPVGYADRTIQIIQVTTARPLCRRVAEFFVTVTSDDPGHEWHITIQRIE